MNEQFIRQIENPSSPQQQTLYEQGLEITKDRLEKHSIEGLEDTTLTRLNYTYYHNWKRNDPDFFFLIRDPGKPGDHVVSEAVEIDRTEEILDLIDIYQRIGARWLMGRNYATFIREFLRVCEQKDLVELTTDWWEYVLTGSFFDDFYMTDVVKYRIDEDPTDSDLQDCFTSYLFPEIDEIDPDLIFAFGKTPWKSIRDTLNTKDIETGEQTKPSVTQAQGRLFRTTRMPDDQLFVIPFLHMSPQNYPSKVTIPEFTEMLTTAINRWKSVTG